MSRNYNRQVLIKLCDRLPTQEAVCAHETCTRMHEPTGRTRVVRLYVLARARFRSATHTHTSIDRVELSSVRCAMRDCAHSEVAALVNQFVVPVGHTTICNQWTLGAAS